MYNAEFKRTFLSSRNYANATKQMIISMFKCLAHAERKHQKDLCAFHKEELIESLEEVAQTNVRVLQQYVTVCSRYFDFAIAAKKSVHTQNPCQRLRTRDFLLIFLANATTVFSREEIFRMAHETPNAQNGALLALLFDGVNVRDQYREISSLQIEHVDRQNCFVTLPTRTLHVSVDTCRLLEKASFQHEYIRFKGNGFHSYPLASSSYLFKGMRGTQKVPPSLFQRRIKRLATHYESPELTEANIAYSGLVYHTVQAVENGESWEAALQKTTTTFGFSSSPFSRKLLQQTIEQNQENETIKKPRFS